MCLEIVLKWYTILLGKNGKTCTFYNIQLFPNIKNIQSFKLNHVTLCIVNSITCKDMDIVAAHN